jgi:hypothetical protein
LIPYSVAVEGLTQLFQKKSGPDGGVGNDPATAAAAAAATAVVISLGLQPIEKQIVMDQLLQSPTAGHGTSSNLVRANVFPRYGNTEVPVAPSCMEKCD